MSTTDEEQLKTASDLQDADKKVIELLQEPLGLLSLFLKLQQPRTFCSPFILCVAFYLLPRLKLDFPIRARYLDRHYEDAMLNSSVVNQAYELLSTRYQDRFIDKNPLSGFAQYVARKDISPRKTDRVDFLLSTTPQEKATYQKEVGIFSLALELLFDDAADINDSLSSQKLANYEQQPSDNRTAALIFGLGDFFQKNDYGGINYRQLVILAECIAYVKRFHRNLWRVEVEDVLEAWFLINYCRQPHPPLKLTDKNILNAIDSYNRAVILPSQRQVIDKIGKFNAVSRAVGLKIKSKERVGKLIIDGYVEYDYVEEGYRLTDLGKLVLTNDFHITVLCLLMIFTLPSCAY